MSVAAKRICKLILGVPEYAFAVPVDSARKLARAYLALLSKQSQLEQAERRFMEIHECLMEIHEYHCGCDEPGQLDKCVAQPVVLFADLRPEDAGE